MRYPQPRFASRHGKALQVPGGHLRKDVMEKGEWRDSYLYAVLAEERLNGSAPRA